MAQNKHILWFFIGIIIICAFVYLIPRQYFEYFDTTAAGTTTTAAGTTAAGTTAAGTTTTTAGTTAAGTTTTTAGTTEAGTTTTTAGTTTTTAGTTAAGTTTTAAGTTTTTAGTTAAGTTTTTAGTTTTTARTTTAGTTTTTARTTTAGTTTKPTTTTANTKDAKELQEQIQKAISLRIEIQKRIQQLQREKIQIPVYGTDVVSQQINKLTSDLGKLDTAISGLQKEHADLIGQYFVNLSELQSGIKGSKNVVISDVKDGVLNVYNPFII